MAILLGCVLLVAAGVLGFRARMAQLRMRRLAGTETVPVAELQSLQQAAAQAAGPGVFRYACEVVGRAVVPESGVLRSPLSETECVWHRHVVTRKYEERYRDTNGNRRTRTRTETVSEASSMTDFAVADATGQVAVSPGDGEVVGAEKVLDRFERQLPDEGGVLQLGPLRLQLPSRERTLGFRQEEWVVRPGSFFYVHGAASDDRGRLVMAEPAGGGVFVMSVRTEEELLRAERNRSRYFWIFGAVLAVGGVVSLVVGLVS